MSVKTKGSGDDSKQDVSAPHKTLPGMCGVKAKKKKKVFGVNIKPWDFRVFACGSKGGGFAGQLTSFFIAEKSDQLNFISMDAGTSYDCLSVAHANRQLNKILDQEWEKKEFEQHPIKMEVVKGRGKIDVNAGKRLNEIGYFRQKQLNGFLVTHAHTDHLTGLVISSADEAFGGHKPIIATTEQLKGVQQALNRPAWPNMIILGFYEPMTLDPKDNAKPMTELGATSKKFTNSKMTIQSYPLSHDNSLGPSLSTAFMICNDQTSCILFFGDTAPDDKEWNDLKKGLVVEAGFTGLAAKTYLNEQVKTAKQLDEALKGGLKQHLTTEETRLPKLLEDDKVAKASKQTNIALPQKVEEQSKKTPKKGEREPFSIPLEEKEIKTVEKMIQGIPDQLQHLDAHMTELRKLFKERTAPEEKVDPEPELGEQWHLLRDVWDMAAPKIEAKTLHTIFIECSYDKYRPESIWFGHFITTTLIQQLEYINSKISKKTTPMNLSPKLNVVVMHIKPTFKHGDKDETSYWKIKAELCEWERRWALNGEYKFPKQTDIIFLTKNEYARIDSAYTEDVGYAARSDMAGNLLQSDFGHNGDGDGNVDYGNVNGYGHGQFMHHRQPQYGPKWHESYHDEASQPYVGGGGGDGYYLAPAHPPIHYQSPLNINLLLVTTLLMFLCVCVCCASFVCGFSVRHVMRKLIKKTKRYQLNDDEAEHKYVV